MTALQPAALRTIRVALENAPQRCLYHGTEFERMGMQWGEPRCESCRQPWRVVQALQVLAAAAVRERP